MQSALRLLCLNVWGGKRDKELMQFLARMSESIDIFCFQEVFATRAAVQTHRGIRTNLLGDIRAALPDFAFHYAHAQTGFDLEGPVAFPLSTGNAIFVRKDLRVCKAGDHFVYGKKDWLPLGMSTEQLFSGTSNKYMPRSVPFVQIVNEGKTYTIFNFHGLWNGRGKGDCPERLQQSKNLKNLMNRTSGKRVILCGDFNLLPGTESLKILEVGMKNLITEHSITSTRSSLYTKEPRYADYLLATPDIRYDNFQVLPNEVSDHLPLLLSFS